MVRTRSPTSTDDYTGPRPRRSRISQTMGRRSSFVASRRDTVEAASKASEELADRSVDVGDRGDIEFHEQTQQLDDERLRTCVLDGVAYHNAGLSRNDQI
ncbi:MAG: hypothetical protein U5K37_12960 [Natrialbaceae archaeon]|nr:hypothetical protein [Natrialbaceae archaeon]